MGKEDQFRNDAKRIYRLLVGLLSFTGAILIILLILNNNPGLFRNIEKPAQELTNLTADESGFNAIIDGVHQRTGLLEGEGLMAVVNNCTNCHSAKIIIQNRMSEARWKATIRWMQETQNLWDLGDNEEVIIKYLVNNYPIEQVGRRKMLTDINWYEYSE